MIVEAELLANHPAGLAVSVKDGCLFLCSLRHPLFEIDSALFQMLRHRIAVNVVYARKRVDRSVGSIVRYKLVNFRRRQAPLTIAGFAVF